MNLSFKPAVRYIHRQKARQTSWIYAETAAGKGDDIQETYGSPTSDTEDPDKCPSQSKWPLECRSFCSMGSSKHKMTCIALKCIILHYPQILYPCQTKGGLFFLVLEKIIRSDAIYHIKL